VRVGDRLEMKRDKYCHWGIYMGEQILDIDDQVRTRKIISQIKSK